MAVVKIFIAILVVQILYCSAALSSCEETADAARQAAVQRNDEISAILTVGMPNPEDFRLQFGSCLEVVNRFGYIYSMGISLPSLDSIISQLCSAVSAEINKTINATLNQVNTEIWKVNRYTVSGDFYGLANEVLNRIK